MYIYIYVYIWIKIQIHLYIACVYVFYVYIYTYYVCIYIYIRIILNHDWCCTASQKQEATRFEEGCTSESPSGVHVNSLSMLQCKQTSWNDLLTMSICVNLFIPWTQALPRRNLPSISSHPIPTTKNKKHLHFTFQKTNRFRTQSTDSLSIHKFHGIEGLIDSLTGKFSHRFLPFWITSRYQNVEAATMCHAQL